MSESLLPFHPKQGQRVEWDMNGKTHYGLYVEWLPYPEVLRCNHRVVSEEYGLLTFEDDGKLRPAKATQQAEGSALSRERVGAIWEVFSGALLCGEDGITAMGKALKSMGIANDA